MSTGWKRSLAVVGLAVIAALLLAACGSALFRDTDPAGGVTLIAPNDQPAREFQIILYSGAGYWASPTSPAPRQTQGW